MKQPQVNPETTTEATNKEASSSDERNRDSKVDSIESATIEGGTGNETPKDNDLGIALKEEPGAKWKDKETHEIPYK
jgi:hypothetical protein